MGILTNTIGNLNTTMTDIPLSKLFIIHLLLTNTFPFLLGFCLLVVLTLVSWFGSHEKQTTYTSLPSERDRTYILRRLRLRYEQLLKQSLQGTVQLELELTKRPTAVHNALGLALRLPDQPEVSLSPHTSISEIYEQAQHELLILGEPGAGKSTLLLELARYLVKQAEQNATLPMPVLLPLSTWAVTRRPLHEWLTKEMARLYNVSSHLSQQWIQAEQVLPLLDGMDEMEEGARSSCIAAINIYHHQHLRPLIVCSRTSEYDAATKYEQLVLHAAVIVQPLERGKVDAYLANLGEPLAGLRKALKTNSILQELATTPLLLQVLMLTYHGTSVQSLSRKEAQLREQIWTDYVQRMVQRRGNVKCYPLPVTIDWLRWLAYEMRRHNQTIFSLESLQPDWLPIRQRRQFRWIIGLIYGLFVGLSGGLPTGLFVTLVDGLVVGLIVGLVVALVGLVCGLFVGVLDGVLAGLNKKLDATVQHYILRFWLAHSGIFPWRIVSFLEDANARILLRRVGGGYSFVHRLLLDYFADLDA